MTCVAGGIGCGRRSLRKVGHLSQFRKTLTRIGGSAVALAAATALIVPGVASAAGENESGSASTGSLERATEFLPDEVRTVFKLITSGELDFNEVGECVREEFGQEVVSGNPFQIVIDCVLEQATDDEETTNPEDPGNGEKLGEGDNQPGGDKE